MIARLEPPEVYLHLWDSASELTPSRFLDRLTSRAKQHTTVFSPDNSATPLLQAVDQITDEASLTAFLRESLPDSATPIVDRAGPVLFQMLVYLSRYPFLPSLDLSVEKDQKLDSDGLRRALVLASSDYMARGFSWSPERQRRLIFRSLSRAQSPTANGEREGDEDVQDLVDFIVELQPDVPGSVLMPPYVEHEAFVPVARKMMEQQGLGPASVHDLVLAREDFEAVTGILVVLDLYPGGDPEDDKWLEGWEGRRDKLVRTVFGDEQEVGFERFDNAFTPEETGLPETMRQLDSVVDMLL